MQMQLQQRKSPSRRRTRTRILSMTHAIRDAREQLAKAARTNRDQRPPYEMDANAANHDPMWVARESEDGSKTIQLPWMMEIVLEQSDRLIHVGDYKLVFHITYQGAQSAQSGSPDEPWVISGIFFEMDAFWRGAGVRDRAHKVLLGRKEMIAAGMKTLWDLAVEEATSEGAIDMIDDVLGISRGANAP